MSIAAIWKGNRVREGRPVGSGNIGLYALQRGRLLAMCRAILGDEGAAEDAVQEAFARLSASADRLQGDGTAYLFTLTRNICRDELRRRMRRPTDPLDTGAVVASTDVEQVAIDRSTLAELWLGLSPAERQLLSDAAAGFSLTEMAKRRGSSASAVAQRIHRVRLRMRQMGGLHGVLPGAGLPIPARTGWRGAVWSRWTALMGSARDLDRLTSHVVVGAIAAALAGSGLQMPSVMPAALARQVGPVAAPPAALAVGAHGPAVGVAAALSTAETGKVRAPARPSQLATAVLFQIPQGVEVTSMTISPNYQRDHTAFAAGYTMMGCTSCSRVYHTSDQGTSWHPLRAAGLGDGSTILLPPEFPATHTIFAFQQYAGLLQSDDMGGTFRLVFPMVQGSAVVDPSSAPGDTRVYLLGETTGGLLVYHAATGRTGLAPTGLAPAATQVAYVFTGLGARAVYVGLRGPSGDWQLDGCAGVSCQRVGPAPAQAPVVSDTFGSDRTLFSFDPGVVHVGSLGGTTTSITLPSDLWMATIIPASDYATSRVLEVVATDRSGAPILFRSVAGGPFVRESLGQAAGLALLQELTRLPDGHLLAPLRQGGLECSADQGMSWHPTC